jgi:NAD(P)-dependent dehydrogenase (short-subunit alcohol dehydrogenase family)
MKLVSDQKPRAVLITGCSTGIGHACALDLAARGWRVLAGVRSRQDGEQIVQQAAGDLQPILLDVTDRSMIQAAVERLDALLGNDGLDGLVNNAGIVVPGPLELLGTEDFRRQLEVNVLGTHAVTAAMLPMLRQAKGRIVLMGSITGRITPPQYGAYAASKHALEAMADAWRVELQPWRISVAIVQPDNVDTPIWNKLDQSVEALGNRPEQTTVDMYQRSMQKVRSSGLRMGRTGMPTARVVAAVQHALTARWPRARYPVGWRTRLAFWGTGNLPAWIMDRFLLSAVDR